MKPFEVTVTTSSTEPTLRMNLDAAHWMDAWKFAMSELGLTVQDEGKVRCEIRPDGAVEVSVPDEHERRFLVSSPPAEMHTTQDLPVQAMRGSVRPSITIEEMPAVRPQDHRSSTVEPTVQLWPARLFPAVYKLDGDDAAILREACTMLAGHISAHHLQFLLPKEDRSGWRVALSYGRHREVLQDLELSSTAPLPGPVNHISGRRRFEDPVTLTYTESGASPVLVTVNSGLWATVRLDGLLRGVFLLLNATQGHGFNHEAVRTTQEVAKLVADRLSRD
ncbi:MAG: hypothetical protein ACPGU1_12985 [Myxococcota bacterium]